MIVFSRVDAPRALTLKILRKVSDGAWADSLLRHFLDRSDWERRDKTFVTELVMGTLRYRLRLDHMLTYVSHQPLKKLDPPVLEILRMSAYQILFTRVPAYAACDSAVELARDAGFKRASGFINAVLRNLNRKADEVVFPDPKRWPVDWLSIYESHPRWLVARWVERFGFRGAHQLCVANNRPAPVVVRANRLKTDATRLRRDLKTFGIEAEPTRYAPDGLVFRSGGSPIGTALYQEGRYSIQGEAAQLAVSAADIRPGMHLLDACAGRGGKSTYFAERLSNSGWILAIDVHPERLAQLDAECRRLGVTNVTPRVQDARDSVPETFDIVFVDAPCSATGIVGRVPDARWHKKPEDIARLVVLQGEILRSVAKRVRVGGMLLYSTCSLESEENEQQVSAFLREHPGFFSEPPESFPDDAGHPEGIGATLLPHIHQTDGFYTASLKRVNSA